MFFNAAQTQGAVGAVVPEQSAHSTGPGQQHNLNGDQFPGKGMKTGVPAEGAEGAAGGEAAAGAGAGAEAAELLPLLAL